MCPPPSRCAVTYCTTSIARLRPVATSTDRIHAPRRANSGTSRPTGTNTATFISASDSSYCWNGSSARCALHGTSGTGLSRKIGNTVFATMPARYTATATATSARGTVSRPRRCSTPTRTATVTRASGTTTGSTGT